MASTERFEEAGWVRDRHRALARALEHRRAWRLLQTAGSIRAVGPDGGAAIEQGRLLAAWPDGPAPPLLPQPGPPGTEEVALRIGDAEEAWLIWKWLKRPESQILSSGVAVDANAMAIPRLERIAV